jgi:type VI protein secretion system component Hcp
LTVWRENSGKDKISVLAVGLSEVTVGSYQLGAAGANAEPAETITFTYGKITITNYGPGGGSFCWDLVTRRECQGTVITPAFGSR